MPDPGVTVEPADASRRSDWQTVAVPTEHGGWGLTLEPVLLGLLVAWSVPGLALGVAAFLAFLARTPLKLVLVDRYRQRSLDRTRLARKILAAELLTIAVLAAYVALAAPGRTWIPLAIAAPLIAVELWFDMRSRSRRLVPELAGAIGIGSVSAAIALAGGEDAAVAVGLWCVLAARSIASIPFVRHQVRRAKDQDSRRSYSDAAQLAGAGVAVAGGLAGWVPPLGVVAVILLAALQAVDARLAPRRVVVVGVQQTVLGLAVVALTAVGVVTG